MSQQKQQQPEDRPEGVFVWALIAIVCWALVFAAFKCDHKNSRLQSNAEDLAPGAQSDTLRGTFSGGAH